MSTHTPLAAQSLSGVSVGTAAAAAEDTGLCAGHRGALRSSLCTGRVCTSQLQNNLSELVNPAAPLDECSSSFVGTQGVLQRPFQGVVFEALSLPFVCLYFSWGCWSVISFLTPGSLREWLSVQPCAVPAGGRSQLLHTLLSLSSEMARGHSRKSFMGRGFNFFTIWGCLQLFCTCSNLLVHHPQLPERFCVDLVKCTTSVLEESNPCET